MMQTEVAFPSSMWTLNQTTVSGQPFFYNRGFWCCKAIIAFNNNDCQDLVFCMWHANSSVQCSMCGDRINVNNMGPSLESIFKSTPRNVSMASLGPKREKQHIVLCQGGSVSCWDATFDLQWHLNVTCPHFKMQLGCMGNLFWNGNTKESVCDLHASWVTSVNTCNLQLPLAQFSIVCGKSVLCAFSHFSC